MNIEIKEVKQEKENFEEFEEMLQAGSCGRTSGGCEAQPYIVKNEEK